VHHGLSGSCGGMQGILYSKVYICKTLSVGSPQSLMQVLKVVINQSRPAAARSADPGMPSSHANSLGYFGSYVALSALASPPVDWTSVLRAAAALTVTVILVRLPKVGYPLPLCTAYT